MSMSDDLFWIARAQQAAYGATLAAGDHHGKAANALRRLIRRVDEAMEMSYPQDMRVNLSSAVAEAREALQCLTDRRNGDA